VQANNEFASGSYVNATKAAENAVTAINAKSTEPEIIPLPVIIAAATGAVAGSTVIFLKMRKRRRAVPQLQQEQDPKASANNTSRAADVFQPTAIPSATKVDMEEGG
jgi:hypothetical protein